MTPSTSLSISNCTTASATLRRKSPSPALARSSASGSLSSVIGSSRLSGEASQLHLSQPIRWPPQPNLAAKISTTTEDANDHLACGPECHHELYQVSLTVTR